MISKFMNLEPEKRERIIHAALQEFAQKGYTNASTNEIVKNANISKGLLFHYFSSKKNVYLFLLDYSKDIFLEEFYNRMDFEERDFIKRWRQIVLLKTDLIRNHLELYEFMMTAVADDSIEIKQEIEKMQKKVYEDFIPMVMKDVDTSVFKDGVDVRRAMEIIIWSMQGFANNELEKMKHIEGYRFAFDLNAIMAQFDIYIELLKNAFYK